MIKFLKTSLKWLCAIALLIIAIGIFDILKSEAESFAAQRERNKPKAQNFSFLGEKYHIPARELNGRIHLSQQYARESDRMQGHSSIEVPYMLGRLRIYDATLQDARWSYKDIHDTTDPYEIYESAEEYNEHFQFHRRRRSLNKNQINGTFVSRNPLFANQRVVVRCYYSGLVNSCMVQTYRPLNDAVEPLLVIEDNVDFRPPDRKPCTMREKEKHARKIRKGKQVYGTCVILDDILNLLPLELTNLEQSMKRWRANAESLSYDQSSK